MRTRRPPSRHRLLTVLLAAATACGGGAALDPGPGDLSQAALDQARALRMSLSHASVGANLWGGLTALAAEDATRYAFPNWADHDRGNPGWQAKVDDFETFVAANLAAYDVFQNKLCYIDQDASFTYYRDSMLRLEGLYPAKRLVWWTMPLMTSGAGDNALRAAFNQQVRTYCAQHAKPLFDIAALESHDAEGRAVTEGGVEAMWPGWCSDGGHLNAAGAERIALEQWRLMARLAEP